MRPRGHFRMSADRLKNMAGGFWYHSAESVRGVHGVVYLMNDRLQDWERAEVERYGNTRVTDGRVGERRKFHAVFIGERCFTEGEKLQRELVFEN